MGQEVMQQRRQAYLAALHQRGQQTHVELRSGRPDVVFGPHQLDVLSAGQVGAKGHCDAETELRNIIIYNRHKNKSTEGLISLKCLEI